MMIAKFRLQTLFWGFLWIVGLASLGSCRIAGICADKECHDDKDVNVNEGDECRNTSFLGTWKRRDGDELIQFTSNCQFSSPTCHKTGTFTKIADEAGNFDLTLSYMGAVDSSCPPAGEYACRFDLSDGGSVFDVNCKNASTGDRALGGVFELND
jgi:hypothetical protein